MALLPDCPAEQNWVLGDDGQLAAEVGQPDAADVHAVDQDGAATALHQPEQGHAQRGLTCTQVEVSRRQSNQSQGPPTAIAPPT